MKNQPRFKIQKSEDNSNLQQVATRTFIQIERQEVSYRVKGFG